MSYQTPCRSCAYHFRSCGGNDFCTKRLTNPHLIGTSEEYKCDGRVDPVGTCECGQPGQSVFNPDTRQREPRFIG